MIYQLIILKQINMPYWETIFQLKLFYKLKSLTIKKAILKVFENKELIKEIKVEFNSNDEIVKSNFVCWQKKWNCRLQC